MVVSSLALEPRIQNPERSDVFPFSACSYEPNYFEVSSTIIWQSA
jgi:hypothetical protein